METCFYQNCDKPAVEGEYDYPGLCPEHVEAAKVAHLWNEQRGVVRDAVETIYRLSNDGRLRGLLFDVLQHDHRTNQQLFMKMIIGVIEQYAALAEKGPGYYDARNEDTVKFCKEVVDKIKDRHLRYI